MKKTLKTLIAAVLTLSILFTFAGCFDFGAKIRDAKKSESKKVDPIIGKWEAEVDVVDALYEGFGEMGGYFDIDEFVITLIVTFEEDGDVRTKTDKDATEEAVKALKPAFEKGMRQYLADALAMQGINMTVDAYLKEQGTSMSEIINQSFGDDAIEEMVDDMSDVGVYKVKGNKLYMADDEDELEERIEDGEYTIFSIKGKKLIWEEYVGEDDENMSEAYPITFKKVK